MQQPAVWQLFLIFLRLGLTSFGGPVAHIGYFRQEFVERRRWLSEQQYLDVVALCQFLPGPASSQVGMAIGLYRGHYAGALAAWLGFTLPSAALLSALALGLSKYPQLLSAGLLHGLKLVAVAVVIQAVWGMSKALGFDRNRLLIMASATLFLTLGPAFWPALAGVSGQLSVLLGGALCGALLLRPGATAACSGPAFVQISSRAALGFLLAFVAGLLLLPWLAATSGSAALSLVDSFYRSGALVFGGGHVVLPLLEAEVVGQGALSADTFMAGYGATQAVPGPMFSFAAFVGAAMQTGPGGVAGASLALLAIFLPSFLILAAALPFWQRLRTLPLAVSMLAGVNSAVVGLLLAVLYDPIWTQTVHQLSDVGAVLLAYLALQYGRCPPWLAVVLGGALGAWFDGGFGWR